MSMQNEEFMRKFRSSQQAVAALAAARKIQGINFSSVKRWVKQKDENMFIKGDYREPTHLLLDCGKFAVPDELMDWFYKNYATDILQNQINYIAECKTGIYKMIMDLDFYDDKPKSYDDMKPYLQVIQDVVSSFYPHLPEFQKRMIVCTTEYTDGTVKGNRIFVKQGLGHLIWPGILINNEIGTKIRIGCIQELIKRFGQRHSENIWEDVVDATIYQKNGLRMVGSAKMGVCKICKKKQPRPLFDRSTGFSDNFGDCDICMGLVKYYGGRIYAVTDVVDTNSNTIMDELEKLQREIVYMVKQTSIRSKEKFYTEYKTPDWFDLYHFNYEQEMKNKKIKRRFYNDAKHELTDEDKNGIAEHAIKGKISMEHAIWKSIVKLINDVMPEIYKNVEIMDIKQCSGDKSDYYLVRTNSSFCMNIAKHHNSNTIYFVVNEMGICQKCFCRCETTVGRRFGIMCKDYHSEIKPFNNSDTIKLLFPDSFLAHIESWNRLQLTSCDINKDKIMQQLKNNIKCCQDYIMGKPVYEERFSSNEYKKKNYNIE